MRRAEASTRLGPSSASIGRSLRWGAVGDPGTSPSGRWGWRPTSLPHPRKGSSEPASAAFHAKVEKVRDGGRVRRKCVVIAHGVHDTGLREILALDVGAAETEAFWTDFLRGLVTRRPGRRAAGHLRRPRGSEERDRQGARRAVAALHGALPARLPGTCSPRSARPAGGADPPDRHGLIASSDSQRFAGRLGLAPRRARVKTPNLAVSNVGSVWLSG
jgi:hypothetical protein